MACKFVCAVVLVESLHERQVAEKQLVNIACELLTSMEGRLREPRRRRRHARGEVADAEQHARLLRGGYTAGGGCNRVWETKARRAGENAITIY